jgi:hypothetical protein
MARINVFGLGQASKSPFVTANALVNMYCETRPAGEKSRMVGYRTPGFVTFADASEAVPWRGAWAFEKVDLAYGVISNSLFRIGSDGSLTLLGSLNTFVGRVSMADNGTQLMIVDGTDGYIYNTDTGVFVQITDPDFPSSPLSVTFLAGRFIINLAQSNRYYWSDLYDGLAWDALNFASAEASSDPILRSWESNGQLVLFGTRTTEFAGVSSSADSAFASIGGTASEWGIAAPWSLSKFDNSLMALWRNRMGQVMVGTLNGYLPKKVSSVDMDTIINGYATTNDASGYSYMWLGHPFYVINFPSESASWLYDGSTGIWSQLKSHGLTRHRAEFALSFLTYTLLFDFSDGKVYTVTNVPTEDGELIESHIISETVAAPDLDTITIDTFRIDCQVGQSSSVDNPQIGLRVSRDNGRTWGTELMRSLGKTGEYKTLPEWNRLGASRTFVFDLRITDPVQVVLVSAIINPND